MNSELQHSNSLPPRPLTWSAGHDARRNLSRSLETWQNGLVPPPCSTSPGTDLCRRTFCRGCGGSRHSGEHSLWTG